MPQIYVMGPTATFRLSIANMCSKPYLRQPMNIEYWCTTYRFSVQHLVSKYDLGQVKNFVFWSVYLRWTYSLTVQNISSKH